MRSHHRDLTAQIYKALSSFGVKPDDGQSRPKHVVITSSIKHH